jgi:hypothetical protein
MAYIIILLLLGASQLVAIPLHHAKSRDLESGWPGCPVKTEAGSVLFLKHL